MTSSSPGFRPAGPTKGAAPVPGLLRWWLALERRLYGGPTPASWETETDERWVVLYDGKTDIRSLWNALLRRRAPVIQVGCRAAVGGHARLLAESRIAIPEKELIGRSLAICLQRQRALLERANRVLNQAPSLSDREIPIDEAPVRLSRIRVLQFMAFHVFRKLRNQILNVRSITRRQRLKRRQTLGYLR